MNAAAHMIGRLPLAWQEGPAFQALLGALGEELDRADAGLVRLLRARQLALAEGWDGSRPEDARHSELCRLAALLALEPDPGESARAFRQRIQHFLAIHAVGLGSARAILQLAAAELRAHRLPEPSPAGPGIERIRVPIVDRDGVRKSICIDLEDFPERRHSLDVALAPGAGVTVQVVSMAPVLPELRVTPEDGDLATPLITAGGAAFLMLGVLAAGSTLQLRHLEAPLVDGAPTELPILTLAGGTLDGGRFGASAFAAAKPEIRFVPLADGEHTICVESASPSLVEALSADLDLSAWVVDSERFDDPPARFTAAHDRGPGARYAGAAPRPRPPAGDAPRALRVQASWIAREPATFALHFPVNPLPAGFRDDLDLARALGRAVEYGRAAGVRPRLLITPSMEPERLDIGERLRITLGVRLSESIRAEDAPGVAAHLTLVEDASPRERAAITHTHDAGLFGGTLFAEPGADPAAAGPPDGGAA